MTEPSLPHSGAANAANAYRAPAHDAVAPPSAAAPTDHGVAMRMLLPVGRSGWSIVAGYLGLFALIIFPAPLALVAGVLAFRDLKKHPEKHGRGRALFGLLMGILGTLVLCFFGWTNLMR